MTSLLHWAIAAFLLIVVVLAVCVLATGVVGTEQDRWNSHCSRMHFDEASVAECEALYYPGIYK
jgi:hypothetical protein